jgi:hypothetical protein
MKAKMQSEPRIQHSYNGVMTVLEGAELASLTKIFIVLMKTEAQKLQADPKGKVLYCALRAYRKLHRLPVRFFGEIKKLSTPDARKADLFFKYACASPALSGFLLSDVRFYRDLYSS